MIGVLEYGEHTKFILGSAQFDIFKNIVAFVRKA